MATGEPEVLGMRGLEVVAISIQSSTSEVHTSFLPSLSGSIIVVLQALVCR